jgi:adenylate cyclase class 2
LLTFKGPRLRAEKFKIREELETEVSSPQNLLKILERVGFRLTFRYQKFRSVFRKGKRPSRRGPVLALDETPIGTYIEIEGTQTEIDLVAGGLGYTCSDYITDSYLQLFLKKKKGRARRREMVFPARNEKNP